MKLSFIAGLLLIAGSALADCTDENKATMKSCMSAVTSGGSKVGIFGTKEDADKFCKVFEENDDCKKAVPVFTANGDCIKEVEDLLIGSMQIMYLSYCGKDDKNAACPLSSFITEHSKELSESKDGVTVTDDLKKVLVEDCKNTKCNSNMKIVAGIVGNEKISATLTSQLNGLDKMINQYKDNYTNNKCDEITGAGGNDEDAAVTLKSMTYTFIVMILLSILMLI